MDVTVRGQIDPRTGMVCDLSALQRLVDDLVVEPFDHTFLNKDVPFFEECVPTAENACRRARTMRPRFTPKHRNWRCPQLLLMQWLLSDRRLDAPPPHPITPFCAVGAGHQP